MSYGIAAALLVVATLLCGAFSTMAWRTGGSTPPPFDLLVGDQRFIWCRWMIWTPLMVIAVVWVGLGAGFAAERPVITNLRSYAAIAVPWFCVWSSAATYARLRKNASAQTPGKD